MIPAWYLRDQLDELDLFSISIRSILDCTFFPTNSTRKMIGYWLVNKNISVLSQPNSINKIVSRSTRPLLDQYPTASRVFDMSKYSDRKHERCEQKSTNPNTSLVSDLFFRPIRMSISWRQRIFWYMDILRCMDMFLITKILDLAYVQNYRRCLSQNKSDIKLFRVYVFTVFTIKRPRLSLRSLP